MNTHHLSLLCPDHCLRAGSGLLLLLLLPVTLAAFARAGDDLAKGFASPPDSARPWVYAFIINGHLTKEGITADLEAMKRVGIGGMTVMEVSHGAPPGSVDFMGTQWRALFQHWLAEAQRLGLEVNMNNDAGWEGSGGPWIKPAQSMQTVVWSEINIGGPRHFAEKLPRPTTNHGFYRDIAVLAMPASGANRIEYLNYKSAVLVGGVHWPAATKSLPPETVVPRQHLGSHRPNGKGRSFGLERTRRQLDNHAHRPHEHRGGSHARAGSRLRPGVRQNEQGSH